MFAAVAGIWSGMRSATRSPYDSSCSILAGLFVMSRTDFTPRTRSMQAAHL